MENYLAFVSLLQPKALHNSCNNERGSNDRFDLKPVICAIREIDPPDNNNSNSNLEVKADQSHIAELRSLAVSWVWDEVGKNNFTDTLDDTKPLKEYRAGNFVLQYSDETKLKILVYWIAEVPTTWWSTIDKVPNLIGWFGVIPVNGFINKYKLKYGELEAELKLAASKSKAMDELYEGACVVALTATEKLKKISREVDLLSGENAAKQLKIQELEEKIASMGHEMDLLREDAKYAVRTHSTPQTPQMTGYTDELVEELKNFNMTTLKKTPQKSNRKSPPLPNYKLPPKPLTMTKLYDVKHPMRKDKTYIYVAPLASLNGSSPDSAVALADCVDLTHIDNSYSDFAMNDVDERMRHAWLCNNPITAEDPIETLVSETNAVETEKPKDVKID